MACVLLAACAHPRTSQEGRQSGATRVRPEPSQAPPAQPAAASYPVRLVDFTRDVRPLLEQHCQPCHFQGGKIYDRLPFDEPDTVRQVGTKLFTRIKAESDQAVIRQFLSQDH